MTFWKRQTAKTGRMTFLLASATPLRRGRMVKTLKTQDELSWIVKALKMIMVEGGYSTIVVSELLKQAQLNDQQAKHFRKVVYGTIENWLYLEEWLKVLADKRIKQDIKILILAALYEVKFLQGMPDHVVVNRYVEYVNRQYKFAKAFVNAILRRAYREPLDLSTFSDQHRLSLLYSHPQWLVKLLHQRFGADEAEAILQANCSEKPLSIRMRVEKYTVEEVISELEREGVLVERVAGVSSALIIKRLGSIGLSSLSAFKKGMFIVQDLSSILVGVIASPKKGDVVLDVCSAPGGKTTDLAERVGQKGKVIACDIHEHKLALVSENSKRLQLDNIEVRLQDATTLENAFIDRFDCVLLDAPCSGLGIIGRKPEIKYRKNQNEVQALVTIQKRMLHIASHYVKSGGNLIYSTCTILDEENDKQVLEFLSMHPEFVLETIQAYLPERLQSDSSTLTLLQSNGLTDGFFIAKLKRLR